MRRFWAAILQTRLQTETKIKFWFSFFILFSASAWGQAQFGVRVITFNGNTPWQANETTYMAQADDTLKTTNPRALFKTSNVPCDDILRDNQQRTLDKMFEDHYITAEVYAALSNTLTRVHDMTQYILATAIVDMDLESAARYEPERVIKNLATSRAQVSMGTLFIVRGYDIEREGVVPKILPLEVARLSPGLKHRLNREKVPVAIEFSRALNEKDSPPEVFRALIHVLMSIVAADFNLLDIEFGKVPVFAHVYRSVLADYFGGIMGGVQMTPEIQAAIENDPAEYFQRRKPANENGHEDSVVVTSFVDMMLKFYHERFSGIARELRELTPPGTPLPQLQELAREIITATRDDYSFDGSIIHVRDYGTPFFDVKLARIFRAHGFVLDEEKHKRLIEILMGANLSTELDSADWLDSHIYVPKQRPWLKDKPIEPTIFVSNLKKDFFSAEAREEYLGKLIVSIGELLDRKLEQMQPQERVFVANEMALERARRGLPSAQPPMRIQLILETYNLFFATDNANSNAALARLGAEEGATLAVRNPHSAGVFDTNDLDDPIAAKINEILERNMKAGKAGEYLATPAEHAEMNKVMFNANQIYRIKIETIDKALARWPLRNDGGPRGLSIDQFHLQRLQRQFITYF